MQLPFRLSHLLLLLTGVLLGSCGTTPTPQEVTGHYRAVVQSPGGELAFPLHVVPEGKSLQAYTVNGADTVTYSDVFLKGDSLIAGMDYYDAWLRAGIPTCKLSVWPLNLPAF